MNLLKILSEKCPLIALQLRTEKRQNIPFPTGLPFPKEETVALYLHTLGPLNWQKKILDWLDHAPFRKVYFIPRDPQILYAAFLPLLQHPRLNIGSAHHPYAWEHLFKPWELIGGSPDALGEWILNVELTCCLYNDFGISLMANVFDNLLIKTEVKKGDALKGRFQNIPALICGAGPSLEDYLDEIKKVQDQVLIIGGGSALSPLSRANISIHFSAAVDPDPPTERFYRQNYFEVPLFYQNQVSHTLLTHHHGPKLCLGCSGNFPLEHHLTENLVLPMDDIGWNVSTFSTKIAALLGCNPIYFVGLDLCVYDKASYAVGVEGTDEHLNPIPMKDRQGNIVFTRPDFLMSKKWLEEFANKHLEITFINVGARGLKLEGIQDGPLKVSSHYADLSAKVHQQVMSAPIVDASSTLKKLDHLDKSLIKTRKILMEYMEALEGKKSAVLQECELQEELFFQEHLLPLWEVWKHLLQTEETLAKMVDLPFEKKLQQILFYQDVTEKFCYERHLPV